MAGGTIGTVTIDVEADASDVPGDVQSDLGKLKGAGQRAGQDVGEGIKGGIRASAIGSAIGNIFADFAGRAAQAIGDFVGDAVAQSDAIDKFKQTLSFAGLDTSAIEEVTAKTQAYADATVYGLQDIQSLTASLASNGVEGYAELAEAAGNLNAVAGGNAETFKSVGTAIAQTAGAGKLTTENFNQLTDAVSSVSGPLQDTLRNAGAYTGNFREAMEKGEITAEEFNAAIMDLGTEPVAVEAATSVSTMEGAVGNLSAALTGSLAGAFSAIKPTLTGFVNGLASAVTFIQENINWIGPLAAGIGIAAAAWAAYNGVMALVAAYQAAAAVAEGGLTVAQWLLNAAMSANPIGLIVIAIGLLIGAIILLVMNWDTVVAFLTDVWNGFVTWIVGVTDGLVAWWNALWAGFGSWVTEVWTGFVGFLTDVWNGFITWIMGVLDGFVGWWNGIWSSVGSFITDVWNGFVNWVQSVWQGFISWIMAILIAYVSFWLGIWNGIRDTIQNVWNGIVNWVRGVVAGFVGWLQGAFNGFISFWSGLWNNVSSTVQSIWGGIISWFGGIPGAIMGIFSGAVSWLVDAGSNIVQGLWNGLKGMWDSVVSWFQDATSGIIDTVTGLLGIASPSKVFADIGKNLMLGLGAGVSKNVSAATGALTSAVEDMMVAASPAMTLNSGLAGMTPGTGTYTQAPSAAPSTAGGLTVEAGAFQISGPDPYRVSLAVVDRIAGLAAIA